MVKQAILRVMLKDGDNKLSFKAYEEGEDANDG